MSPSFSGRKRMSDELEQLVNVMMEEIPVYETSLIDNAY